MRKHPVYDETKKFWKSYPVRIPGHFISECCRKPTLLVQSMEGGYVTRNCSVCGEKDTLPNDVFFKEVDLWVACPACKEKMTKEIVPSANYGFVCQSCNIYILLADLLPKWEDL